MLFFFFQAEDGIRDHCVTGVQTCALPILIADAQGPKIGGVCVSDQRKFWRKLEATVAAHGYTVRSALEKVFVGGLAPGARVLGTCGREIGRASCRERV